MLQPSHTSSHNPLHHANSLVPVEMRESLDPKKSHPVLPGNGREASDEVQRFLNISKLNSALNDDKVLFSCFVCKKKFSNDYNLRIHLNKHFKILKFTCKYCHKSFSDPAHLYAHNVYHFGDLEKKIECNYCQKKFATKFLLKRHLFTHDKNLCRFMCSICEFRTATSRDLKYHKRIHSQKSVSCDLCGKTFYNECDLKKHRIVHSGIRNFTCEICHEEFNRHGNLVRHLKVHNSCKFKCTTCGAHYANAVCLTRHIKWHKANKTETSGWSLSCDVLKEHEIGIREKRLRPETHTRLLSTKLSDRCWK